MLPQHGTLVQGDLAPVNQRGKPAAKLLTHSERFEECVDGRGREDEASSTPIDHLVVRAFRSNRGIRCDQDNVGPARVPLEKLPRHSDPPAWLLSPPAKIDPVRPLPRVEANLANFPLCGQRFLVSPENSRHWYREQDRVAKAFHDPANRHIESGCAADALQVSNEPTVHAPHVFETLKLPQGDGAIRVLDFYCQDADIRHGFTEMLIAG